MPQKVVILVQKIFVLTKGGMLNMVHELDR